MFPYAAGAVGFGLLLTVLYTLGVVLRQQDRMLDALDRMAYLQDCMLTGVVCDEEVCRRTVKENEKDAIPDSVAEDSVEELPPVIRKRRVAVALFLIVVLLAGVMWAGDHITVGG